MRITTTFTKAVFDEEAYKELFEAWMEETLTMMASAYLQATAINIVSGPFGEYRVWRGASAATFLKLADTIKFNIPLQNATPAGKAEGAAHGYGGMTIDGKKGKGSFFYSTDLVHLVWNEYHNANVKSEKGFPLKLRNPGPYHFQEAGQIAVDDMIRDLGINLPDPWLAIKITKIKVS